MHALVKGLNHMSRRRGLLRTTAALIAALTTVAVGAEAAQGAAGHAGTHRPAHQARELSKLLSPAQKYYGVYVSQAPSLMAPINKVTQETGKQPNLSLFYESWGAAATTDTSNINLGAIENACDNGMLPMLTWETWNTSVNGPNGGPAWSQPNFSPATIASGAYDSYIEASAEKIKSLNCPIALRLDQEFNGYWYPWGLNTAGMNNTPADYVAMWRHIHDIFNSVGATNVLWVWSPNVQSTKHKSLPDLSASYPGDNYVDWVGIDGYYLNNPTEKFGDLFQPTINQLKTFVSDKPWIIAEAGVGSGASKPAQIKNLVHAVARRRRFNGLNYFDINKPSSGSDWAIDETQASLDAFKSAINSPVYGAGTPGTLPGQ
jgi:mannan endo-1,4-beta-mannosidase